jgi:hypothetical protein
MVNILSRHSVDAWLDLAAGPDVHLEQIVLGVSAASVRAHIAARFGR